MANIASLASEKGTYILVLEVSRNFRATVGRLGSFNFSKGCYFYVGSAFGNGGIRSRLLHHMNQDTVPHWHMDYFKKGAKLKQILFSLSTDRLEHQWAEILSGIKGLAPAVRGFGSSDCACPTHFFLLPRCLPIKRHDQQIAIPFNKKHYCD